MSTIYKINKGINKPIEFKGLKAQYIGYLGAGVFLLLIIFAILHISGINVFVNVVLILILGTSFIIFIYRLSDKYGQYGLSKKMARRNVPGSLLVRSRRTFTQTRKKLE